MADAPPRGVADALDIQLGFCRSPDADADVLWAAPSFAPDHVDDGAVAEAARSSALRVELLFDRGSMHTLCRARGAGAADAIRTVAEPLPGGYTTDLAEWARRAAESDAEALCGAATGTLRDGSCVRRVDLTRAETVAFVMRLTNAMLWLIDGCTAIEIGPDGARWHLFSVWRDGALVAGATCFSFVVPVRRMRVCQFLVIPGEQRRGVGAQLLAAIYEAARSDGAMEVNVEDPCAGFRALRDAVDATRARALRAAIDASGGAAAPSMADVAAAKKELLLSNEQTQRLVEILRLRALDAGAAGAPAAASDDALTAFRVGCKRRLLKANDETLAHLPADERKRKLGEMFDEAADEYRRCARKLAD
ncbi:hypothetical protein KFE25_003889 [Diacronema lutheri]|uniref:N-acetyltransferase domain-containing protein n=1 Tax=Diacronema lutheri TaxID=2081491 RepID=A0A8J5X8J6_DIALT|nr:hypothetical protein KFE25_003889 [Diacronema lutheri]